MTEYTSHCIPLGSGKATYLEAGSKTSKTVLLLHGGGFDHASLSWRLLIPELSTAYRVIAPNWPGYAGTSAFDRPYTIADIGTWLMTFMDLLEIERASMIGVSMGGGAALWSAISQPQRVEALLPVCTYGVAERGPYHLMSYCLTRIPLNAISYAVMRRYPSLVKRAIEAIFANPDRITPNLLDEVHQALRAGGNGTTFTNFQRGEMTLTRLRSAFAADLRSVAHPTLFVHGRDDLLVPLQAIEAVARSMPSAAVEVLDAGHWPMREVPDQFNRVVTSFLHRALQ